MTTSGRIPQRKLAGSEQLGQLKRMLTGRVAIAASYTASAMIISQILRLGGNLIITRILAPDIFGVMSIVIAVQITLALLLDVGLRAAVVQSPRGEDVRFLNTAWTMQILRGVIIWLITAALAAALAVLTSTGVVPSGSAWAAPGLPLILAVASLSAIIGGFESTNAMTAERNLTLKRLVAIQLFAHVCGVALMILLGLLTGSIWSLVFSALASSLILTSLTHLYLPGIKNRPAWDKAARGELSKFGSWILISSVTSVLAANVDRIALGVLVDAATLGYYAIALNFAMLISAVGSAFIGSVVLPTLSEVARNDPESFRKKYFRLRLPWDLAFLASSGALFVLGPMIIKILYDDRYLPAGEMLQILALSLIFFRYNFTNFAYLAIGKPSLMAWVNTARLVSITVLMFILYYYFGLTGALFAIAMHMLPVVPIIVLFNRDLNLNSFRFEMLVLAAAPAGYAIGSVMLLVLNHLVG